MTLGEKIRAARKAKGLTQKELASKIGAAHNSISNWENNQNNPDPNTIQNLCWALDVQPNYFFDDEYTRPSPHTGTPSPVTTDDVVSFPVVGEVAAGFDHYSYENWAGDSIEIPRSYLHGRDQSDFFVLKVIGDSMYPDYQDGDHVLVLRQSTMDRSGQIGVVIYGDDKGTLKRIEYVPGEDWMTMRPINPQYPPVTIKNEALEHCTVLGVAKMVIRDLEQ